MNNIADRARDLLREIMNDPCRVDRYDGSYLDDLPDILREMGLKDDEFRSKRLTDSALQDRFQYSRMKSWDGARSGKPDDVKTFQEEYSRKVERSLMRPYALLRHPWYFTQWLRLRYEIKTNALTRLECSVHDPWTPLFQNLIAEGKLAANDPVLTLGPRWLGEIKYFRKVIGLRKTIGLDLYSYNRRLVVAGDMHAMPFEDSRFALVFQRNTFDKAYDIRKVLRECVRVLKNGGILVSDDVLDYVHGVDEAARTSMTSNEWLLRALHPHIDEVLYSTEDASGNDWVRLIGRVAVRIRK